MCLSSLCHYTLIFSLIYLKKQMSVWKSLLCHIRVLFDILPSFFTLIEKRCIIKKYGPYFLFIYADSTVLAVPVDLLFCSPTSSCSNWADQCRIKRFLKSLDVASVDESVIVLDCADTQDKFRDKTPFIYNLIQFNFMGKLTRNRIYYTKAGVCKNLPTTTFNSLLLSHSDTHDS